MHAHGIETRLPVSKVVSTHTSVASDSETAIVPWRAPHGANHEGFVKGVTLQKATEVPLVGTKARLPQSLQAAPHYIVYAYLCAQRVLFHSKWSVSLALLLFVLVITIPVALHPEMVVTMALSVLGVVPRYRSFAADRIASQIMREFDNSAQQTVTFVTADPTVPESSEHSTTLMPAPPNCIFSWLAVGALARKVLGG